MKIIPAILTNNPQELKIMINEVEGKADRVQIDILDGIFANNKTIAPQALEFIETNLKLDFQLMVKEPIHWVEKCVHANADRIIGHIEIMADQFAFVEKVQSTGVKVGLGIDLHTPLSRLHPQIINNLDVVLLMSAKAGFGGQKFNPQVLPKIKALAQLQSYDQTPFSICVDGGITLNLVDKLIKAGANELAIGKRLFKGNLKNNLKAFQHSL
jgi:ribulose-phosphate 3-epimerase